MLPVLTADEKISRYMYSFFVSRVKSYFVVWYFDKKVGFCQRSDTNLAVRTTLMQMQFYTFYLVYEKLLSLIAHLYIFRIKRDIEQILKELLVTNNADDETTPDKDGNVN